MAYSGGRGFLGQGRYVEESRDSKAGSCDAGRKIGAAMDVDKLDISEKIAEVSSQGEEEITREKMANGNAEFVGFNDNKEIETTGVFNKFDKENVEKVEEYLDKLEGVIELQEEGGDIVEIFEDEAGIEGKIYDMLFWNLDFWKETGALDFALSVVKNGYVTQLWENPDGYEEPNNKSYEREKDWARWQ